MTLRAELDDAVARAMHASVIGEGNWEVSSRLRRQHWMGCAKAARLAALSFLAARGLTVVPKVATENMLIGIEGDWPPPTTYFDFENVECKKASASIYSDMIAAAPDLFAEAENGEG